MPVIGSLVFSSLDMSNSRGPSEENFNRFSVQFVFWKILTCLNLVEKLDVLITSPKYLDFVCGVTLMY